MRRLAFYTVFIVLLKQTEAWLLSCPCAPPVQPRCPPTPPCFQPPPQPPQPPRQPQICICPCPLPVCPPTPPCQAPKPCPPCLLPAPQIPPIPPIPPMPQIPPIPPIPHMPPARMPAPHMPSAPSNIGKDARESTFAIKKAADSALKAEFNVFCAEDDLTHVAHTEDFCQHRKGNVICFAYKS